MLGNLGEAYGDLGEARRAIEYLGEALVIHEAIEGPIAAKVRALIADLNRIGGA
jgi:hypothetical protein